MSERSSHYDDSSYWTSLFYRVAHVVSNVVTTNNYSHYSWLKKYTWIDKKLECVYNGFPLNSYYTPLLPRSPSEYKYLVIARVSSGKNGLMLIKALELFYKQNKFIPKIYWAGNCGNCQADNDYYLAMIEKNQTFFEFLLKFEHYE